MFVFVLPLSCLLLLVISVFIIELLLELVIWLLNQHIYKQQFN